MNDHKEMWQKLHKEYLATAGFALSGQDLLNTVKPFLSWAVENYGPQVLEWLKSTLK